MSLLRFSCVILLVTACARMAVETIPEQAPRQDPNIPNSAQLVLPAARQTLRLDPDASYIRIYVYPGGTLSHLGHSHAISIENLQGELTLDPRPEKSALSMRFDVAELKVDDPDLRAASGSDFDSKPSPDDIAATKKNMLSEKLLDAERFPQISIDSTQISGHPPELDVTLAIRVKDVTSKVKTRVQVSASSTQVAAWGSIQLSHHRLGLTPFSAFGGALSVKDPFWVNYHLVAYYP